MYHNGLRTFFYLIIANIGIVLPVLAIIMMAIWDWSLINNVEPQILEHLDADSNIVTEKLTLLIGMMFLPVGFFSLVIFQKGLSMRAMWYIILLAFYFLLRWIAKNDVEIEGVEELLSIYSWYGKTFIIANIAAILPAVVAFLNFDEVVSRRMLYRNSSASMFEEQFKYSIAVFADSTTAVTLFIFSIMWQNNIAPGMLMDIITN